MRVCLLVSLCGGMWLAARLGCAGVAVAAVAAVAAAEDCTAPVLHQGSTGAPPGLLGALAVPVVVGLGCSTDSENALFTFINACERATNARHGAVLTKQQNEGAGL